MYNLTDGSDETSDCSSVTFNYQIFNTHEFEDVGQLFHLHTPATEATILTKSLKQKPTSCCGGTGADAC